MQSRSASLYAAVLIVLATPIATAQDKPPEKPWSGQAELSFVSTSGNTRTRTLGAAGEFLYKPGVWSSDLKAAYINSSSEGETKARSLTALVAVSRDIGDHVEAFGQVTFLKNEFAGIRRRISTDVGAAFEVLDRERQTLKLKAGGGHTREERIDNPSRSFATANAGAVYTWKFSEQSHFDQELSAVESLEDTGDWRLLDITALTAGINSVFSVKLAYTFSYLNQPVPGFTKTDTTTSAALVAKF